MYNKIKNRFYQWVSLLQDFRLKYSQFLQKTLSLRWFNIPYKSADTISYHKLYIATLYAALPAGHKTSKTEPAKRNPSRTQWWAAMLPSIQINTNKVGSRDRHVSPFRVLHKFQYLWQNFYFIWGTYTDTHSQAHSGHTWHMVRKTAKQLPKGLGNQSAGISYMMFSLPLFLPLSCSLFCFVFVGVWQAEPLWA